MNAAAMGNAYPLPHVRPTDRPTAGVHGKAPKLCPGTVGRSFPKALSLPPSSSQGEAKGKGGTSLFPWLFKGNSLQGCSGKRSASGRRQAGAWGTGAPRSGCPRPCGVGRPVIHRGIGHALGTGIGGVWGGLALDCVMVTKSGLVPPQGTALPYVAWPFLSKAPTKRPTKRKVTPYRQRKACPPTGSARLAQGPLHPYGQPTGRPPRRTQADLQGRAQAALRLPRLQGTAANQQGQQSRAAARNPGSACQGSTHAQ